jgi:uncharacterized membrane protein YidH (DUF202 family)
MSPAERRKLAGERLMLAWGIAVIPNLLVAFGVEFSGAWVAIRWVLSAIFVVALVAFLVALAQEWRAKRRERSERGRPARS